MADTVRAFIAIELSPEVKQEISRIMSELKRSGARVKWMDTTTIHLTLKFLGDVPESGIADIEEKMRDKKFSVGAFGAALDGIGVFPKWSCPKVIWVGVGNGADRIKQLADYTENVMAELGFKKETRKFSPHITLGRIRGLKHKDKLEEIARGIRVAPVPGSISKMVLFRSELTPGGAVHTAIFERFL